jgi:hypothetical protein
LFIYIMIYEHRPPDICSPVRSLSTISVTGLGQISTGRPFNSPVQINGESGRTGRFGTLEMTYNPFRKLQYFHRI